MQVRRQGKEQMRRLSQRWLSEHLESIHPHDQPAPERPYSFQALTSIRKLRAGGGSPTFRCEQSRQLLQQNSVVFAEETIRRYHGTNGEKCRRCETSLSVILIILYCFILTNQQMIGFI
jgi:hypothetical protein